MSDELRDVAADADLIAWSSVNAVVEGTAWSLEEMRRYVARPHWCYRLAIGRGEAVGALVVGPSMLPSSGYVGVRVLPEARRAGVGTLLFREGASRALALGVENVRCEVRADDVESLAFAQRRGFVEWAREIELVRTLGGDETEPTVPAGLEVVPLSERPELLDSAWEVCLAGYDDLPLGEPVHVSRDEWLEEDVCGGRVLADLTLVAVRDGRVEAFAGMLTYGADPAAAENGLTAVRRELRGQGLCTLVKHVQAARAARRGLRQLVTSTQEGNDAMRAVNASLGYVPRPAWIKLAAPVAAVERALAP